MFLFLFATTIHQRLPEKFKHELLSNFARFDHQITLAKRKNQHNHQKNLQTAYQGVINYLASTNDINLHDTLQEELKLFYYASSASIFPLTHNSDFERQKELIISCCSFFKPRLCGYLAYSEKLNELIISVQGSKTLPDFITDAQIHGQTHTGFLKYALEIYPQILLFCESIQNKENMKIKIVGHSLGGAGAYILTNLLCHNKIFTESQITLRTYALPKNWMGEQSFATFMQLENDGNGTGLAIPNIVETSDLIDQIHYGYADDPIIQGFKLGKNILLKNVFIKQEAENSNGPHSIKHWCVRKCLPHSLYLYDRLIRSVFPLPE